MSPRTCRAFGAALLTLGLVAAVVAVPPSAGAVPGSTLPYSWIRQWNGGEVHVAGAAALPDGGLVVAGTGRWYKAFVRAYNTDGSLRWSTTWDVPDYVTGDVASSAEWVRGVAVDLSGNTWVVGRTKTPIPGIASVAAGTQVGFLMKLDAAGQLVLTQSFAPGDGTSSSLSDVAVSRTGQVYVTGSTNAAVAGALNSPPAGGNGYRVFAARFSGVGYRLWLRWITGDVYPPESSIAVDAGERVFVAGGTRNPTDAGPLTFGEITAYTRMLDGQGAPMYFGAAYEPAASGFSTIADVAVDASGRVTVVGDAAGRLSGAATGARGTFVLTYRPNLTRVGPPAYQGAAVDTTYQSVAISGRGNRTVLGATDPYEPGAGYGEGDLVRMVFPAPVGSGVASSRPIGTTFDEAPYGMANAYAPKGGPYYDAASGRGPYQGTTSSLNAVGFVGANTSVGAAPWYPYASPTAAVNDLATRLVGSTIDARSTAAYAYNLSTSTWTPGALIGFLRGTTDNQTKVDPVARLFRAYFLRSPDLSGFDHWVKKLRGGTPLSTVSSAFAASGEFTTRYGSLTNRAFVEKVYLNVFGRAGDEGGITYWTAKLDQGKKKRGEVMTNFSESTEGVRLSRVDVDADVTYLQLADRPPSATERSDWSAWADNTPVVLRYGMVFQDVRQFG